MHFLIDYENVGTSGLHGAFLLTPSDKVTIFYGDPTGTISCEYLEQLQNSGCKMEFVRVTYRKKNALDFYIATYIAELLNRNEKTGRLCIVSKDQDFESLRDYWTFRRKSHPVYCGRSIMYGFAHFGYGGEQKTEAMRLLRGLRLKDVSSHYELVSLLGPEVEHLDQIAKLIEQMSGRELYLVLLKLRGRVKGIETYRKLREAAERKEKHENSKGLSC